MFVYDTKPSVHLHSEYENVWWPLIYAVALTTLDDGSLAHITTTDTTQFINWIDYSRTHDVTIRQICKLWKITKSTSWNDLELEKTEKTPSCHKTNTRTSFFSIEKYYAKIG